MQTINIKLTADRIRAAAGEKVEIVAKFDTPAYASVNERRDMYGYQNVMRTRTRVTELRLCPIVHSDTTDFIVMADTTQVPHLKDRQNAVEAWHHVDVIDDAEPTSEPQPEPTDNDDSKIIPFSEMLQQFNEVLTRQGYRPADSTTMLYAYLSWAYNYADNAYRTNAWMMRDETYPLVFNYHGSDTTNWQTAYNAMQAWLMALILAELAADWGEDTNTQTELLKRAYIIGGNCCYPLYNSKTLKADR